MGNGVSGREGQTTPGRSDVVISDLLKRLVSDESEPPIEPYHPSASYGSLAGRWQHLYTSLNGSINTLETNTGLTIHQLPLLGCQTLSATRMLPDVNNRSFG